MEARLNALHGALKEAQALLAEATTAAEADRRARAAAERACAAAEDAASRVQREAEQRLQRAEAASSAAAVQVAEFRRALAGVERERDELAAERAQRERASREAAAAVAGARRRTGDGGLQPGAAERSASLLSSAGSAGLASPAEGGLPSPLPSVRLRDTLEPTDVLYLKNGLWVGGWVGDRRACGAMACLHCHCCAALARRHSAAFHPPTPIPASGCATTAVVLKFVDAHVRCGEWLTWEMCWLGVGVDGVMPSSLLLTDACISLTTDHYPPPLLIAAGAHRSAKCCCRRWPPCFEHRQASTGC